MAISKPNIGQQRIRLGMTVDFASLCLLHKKSSATIKKSALPHCADCTHSHTHILDCCMKNCNIHNQFLNFRRKVKFLHGRFLSFDFFLVQLISDGKTSGKSDFQPYGFISSGLKNGNGSSIMKLFLLLYRSYKW